MYDRIIKYPRTPHLSGSAVQNGDGDLAQIPFSKIKGKHIVIEEKIDGANTAISFGDGDELLLQSRGHFLRGGYRERHYELFKLWASNVQEELYRILGRRYVMYGEWMYAKHRIYYDALPHYFLEFDVLDRETMNFLSTEERRKLLSDSSVISVPVLGEGVFNSQNELLKLLGRSKYITDTHLERLVSEAKRLSLDADDVQRETDLSHLAEGLYIKIEQNGFVTDRMKYVRKGYTQPTDTADSRWHSKPIIPNGLADGCSLL